VSDEVNVIVLGLFNECGYLLVSLRVHLFHPVRHGILPDEGGEIFPITFPELFSIEDPPQGSEHHPPIYEREGIVQPQNRVGSTPHDVPNCHIVTIDDPPFLLNCCHDPLPEDLRKRLRPVVFPMQRVELYVRYTIILGNPSCNSSLPRAGNTHYHDTLHLIEESGSEQKGLVARSHPPSRAFARSCDH
jgi:hypothetical protein